MQAHKQQEQKELKPIIRLEGLRKGKGREGKERKGKERKRKRDREKEKKRKIKQQFA